MSALTPDQIAEVRRLAKATFDDAADGDSNDDEIAVLQEARDMLMNLAGLTEADINPEPQEVGVRYPNIEVQLTGGDGNAFMIIGKVSRILRQSGVADDVIEQYRQEAMSGDYDNVIQTTMRWVAVS